MKKAIVASAGLASLGFGCATPVATETEAQMMPAEASRPNIILVMADDQGWGDAGYNGHPFVKTPNLDAMSTSGVRFNRFYAGAPVCSPTRASVLTGRNPIRTKVTNHGRYIRAEEQTIADALKGAGYVTGHFGKWHVGSVQKQSPVCPGGLGFDEWISAPNFFDVDPCLSDRGIGKQYEGESSKLVVDWTLDFVKRHADSTKPFFAVAWFASPHVPHRAVGEDKKLYEGKPHRGYFQEITAMDREIGRLRTGLREMGVSENTLVWYCSDNGGLVSKSSGGRGKKGSIYEGGLRVPAIIEWPARLRPSVTNLPSFTSDIYPTLLDIVGIEPTHNHVLDGVSIKGVFDGEMQTRPKGMGFWHEFQWGQVTFADRIVKQIMAAQKAGKEIAIPSRLKKDIDEYPQHTTRQGHAAWTNWPWKIHRIQRNKNAPAKYELYNLRIDSEEANDVSAANPEIFATMKMKLDKWQSSVLDSINGKDYK